MSRCTVETVPRPTVTSCITYTGENLDNIGAKKGTKLNTIIKNISNLFKNQQQTGGKLKYKSYTQDDFKQDTDSNSVYNGLYYVDYDFLSNITPMLFVYKTLNTTNSSIYNSGVTVTSGAMINEDETRIYIPLALVDIQFGSKLFYYED